MNFCRWSSNDHQCDVEVYMDVDRTYVVHVAEARAVFPEPLPSPVDAFSDPQGYIDRANRVALLYEKAEMEAIGLPEDGKLRRFSCPVACATYLTGLGLGGYRVPARVIQDMYDQAMPF